MMWPSETEKATKWDLFLPCRATCKVRIPRDSGEKKPTENGFLTIGGGGGNRTRVQKYSTDSSTYLVQPFNLTLPTRTHALR